MQPETLFLLAKFVVALLIAIASLVAIIFGFKMILRGKAVAGQKNSIKIMGLEANVSSLGALMIVSGIGLALVAKTVLPSSMSRGSDGTITIARLEAELEASRATNAAQAQEITRVQSNEAALQEQLHEREALLSSTSRALAETEARLEEVGSEMASIREKWEETSELMAGQAQLAALHEAQQEQLVLLKRKLEESEALNAEYAARLKSMEEDMKKLQRK